MQSVEDRPETTHPDAIIGSGRGDVSFLVRRDHRIQGPRVEVRGEMMREVKARIRGRDRGNVRREF